MGISWNSCKRHGFLRSGSAAVFLVGFCCIANFPFLKDARRESKDNKKGETVDGSEIQLTS